MSPDESMNLIRSKRATSSKQTNFEHLKRVFESIKEEFKLNCFSTKFFPVHSKIETSFVLFEIPKRAKLLTKLIILETKTEIKVQTIACLCWNDLMPITLPHTYLITLMERYFIKLNSSFRFGYFTVDTANGNISFRVNTNTIFMNYWDDPRSLQAIIKLNLSTSYHALKFHIYKILYLINIISREEMEDIPKVIKGNPPLELGYRKIDPKAIVFLDNVRAAVSQCKTNPQQWERHQIELLKFPSMSESRVFLPSIVTPIEILQVADKKHSLTAGGFGELTLVRVSYKIKGADSGNIERKIIIKEEKPHARDLFRENIQNEEHAGGAQRISNETLVLKHFQCNNSASDYVAKFFDAPEENKKEHRIREKAILMEYYPHKSLEHFRMKHSNISLNTKLLLLTQIANGIRFLNGEGVYHLDVKGSNILVQKNYLLRLIDFGESYLSNPHPGLGLKASVYKSTFKPGRTLPYAAPELVHKPFNPDNLNERTDVFSFGMMMGEMLFENFLVDFKKSSLSSLVQKYQTNNYKSKLGELSVKVMGPAQLFKYLRIIALLCISPNPSDRPTHEWLVITLKEAIRFLEKMY